MANFTIKDQFLYNGVVMNPTFPVDILDRVPDFEFRTDDVLIATYPKAGTTWLQQVVWLIVNDADIETSRKVPLTVRSPFLEMRGWDGPPSIDILPQMESPRVIKTHLYYSSFKDSIEGTEKPKFKTIVGMRNVRDVLVSFYHFYQITSIKFDRDFETFFQLFKEKNLLHGDYFDFTLSWFEAKNNPNVYYVKYEDMKKDLRGEIRKIASFLGKTLSDLQVDAVVDESTFKSMQTNPMTNYESTFKTETSKFMRKGKIGDWSNYLSEEQLEYLNKRCEEELAPHGLEFEYM